MQSGDAAARSGPDPDRVPTLDSLRRAALAASATRVLLFDPVRDPAGEVVDFRPAAVPGAEDEPGVLPDPPAGVGQVRLGGSAGLVPQVRGQVLDGWRTALLTGVPDEQIVWIDGVDGRTGTSWDLTGFALSGRLGLAGRPQGPAADLPAATPDAFLAQSLLAAGVSSWEWDPDADILRWISAPPGVLGLWTAGTPLRLVDFLAVVHQVDRGELERAMRGSLTTRTAFRAQFRAAGPTSPARAGTGGGRHSADGRTRVLAGKPPPAGDVDPDDGSLILRMAGNTAIEGGRRRVVGVLEDVTDATRARQALTQNQRLASLGQLAAGIAHDFNNVLTVVTMRADMIRAAGGSDSAQSAEDAVAILDAAARASALTRQLMLFAGHQGGPSADIAVGQVVDDLRPLVDAMREDTFATAYLIGASPPVSTDRVHIEQILVNLALNARDALRDVPQPPNRPLLLTIAVRGQAEDPRESGDRPPPPAPAVGRPPPPSWVVLEVIDTGTGMDHATLARALDPFFTTKPVGAGTGLGLSVVHGLVEQLGGSMTVESVADSGTTVRVFLPGTRPLTPPDTAPRPERPVGARARIVVVDDDEAVRAVTSRSLAMNGFEVVQAPGAEQALAALAREPGIVALVSDVVMPRMSGTDLAARVFAEHPGIPVLLVTGYTPPTDLVVHPLLSLVTKPLTGARLAQSLRDLLDRIASTEDELIIEPTPEDR